MLLDQNIWVGTSRDGAVCLLPKMANRHGLISGATGTGKTVTLQVLAEGFHAWASPSSWRTSRGTWPAWPSPAK